MRVRGLVLGAALALAPAASVSGAQQEHRLLSKLQAVYPHSTPGPVISTPEGDKLFMAEGGALAVIQPSGQSLVQSDFESASKKAFFSSHGVRAVELLLDPAADLAGDPAGPEALVYIAGGRLGLWAQKGDPRPGYPMLASRIDAGTYQGGTGRTWVNSLELMELNETLYLVALFAHKDCSRLRLYELDKVRKLFDPTVTTYAETGNELTPDADVGVGGTAWPRHRATVRSATA